MDSVEMCRINCMCCFGLVFFLLSFTSAQETCIEGKYHKKTASPETAQYAQCHPWKNKTCCTAAFTVELNANQTRTLYNHSWHRCGKLSSRCVQNWLNQECFYQCSPYLYPWRDPDYKGAVKGVPICASVCDRWYQDCETDQICVENVLADYNFTEHGDNFCPSNKSCKTYQQMYGSGKALCEKMWGKSYIYTKENKDSSNCMRMWFDNENPNAKVKKILKHPSGADCLQTLWKHIGMPMLIAVLLQKINIFWF